MEKILETLTQAQPKMPIFLCAVFPSSASQRWPREKIVALNKLYLGLSLRWSQVTYVDTWNLFANPNGDADPEEFPDLLHPNQAGYEKWARYLRPILKRAGL